MTTHPLLALSDDAFVARYGPGGMLDDERDALPADVRRKCTYRYTKIMGHLPSSSAKARSCSARVNGQQRAVIEDKYRGEPTPSPYAAWQPLDLDELAGRDPQPPQFISPDWLPIGYATLLAGHGGIGKSGIALYLAVCMAAGLPFFGLDVERRRVMYLSCEDRENILHWRLSRICVHLGVDLASLRGWLVVADLVGHDAVLWERDPKTGHTFTPAYGALQAAMLEHETEVLFVDGIADTFAGNENARADVKRYVNALVALIPPAEGAVVLIGHLAKPAAVNGQTSEGYSGSTAWHNSVRARWYLFPETEGSDDNGRPAKTGDLLLELQKSNLGKTDQSIRFSWDEAAHLFIGRETVAESAFDRAHRSRTEQQGILRAMHACVVAGINIPAAMTGPRSAYNVLTQRPEFPHSLRAGKPGVRRFWSEIEALRQMHEVEESSYRRSNRHLVATLVLTQQGLRRCAEC